MSAVRVAHPYFTVGFILALSSNFGDFRTLEVYNSKRRQAQIRLSDGRVKFRIKVDFRSFETLDGHGIIYNFISKSM